MALPQTLKRLSINQKLLSAFLVFSLVPLTVASVVAYQQANGTLTTEAKDNLANQSQSVAEKIDRNLFERYGDVQAFAFNPAAQGDAATVENAANFYTKNYGFYDLMVVADLQGNIVATNTINPDGSALNTSALVGKNVSNDDWFKASTDGTIGLGKTDYSEPSEDALVQSVLPDAGYSLRFTAPIFDANGKVVRVWSNFASLDRVAGQIINEQVGALQESGAASAQGFLIADDKTNLLSSEGADPAKATEGRLSGEFHSAGALGFPGYKFSVLTSEKTSDATASATDLRNFLAVLWLICAALVVTAAVFLTRSISRPLAKSAKKVAITSSALIENANEMGMLAQSTAERAAIVSSSSSSVEAHVSTVASAMEEMHASINEIADATSRATSIASVAAQEAESATGTISELGHSSSEIGKVIAVITAIAEQTNLLALNATIEAARAGEAGKGFAVVAQEVKELAKATSRATEEIGSKVSAIQLNTQEAVDVIGRIASVIEEINSMQQTVASAIEEQTATTAEIAQSITQVASGASEISVSIDEVAAEARRTANNASTSESHAHDMETVADELEATINGGDQPLVAPQVSDSARNHVPQPRRFGTEEERSEPAVDYSSNTNKYKIDF